MIVKAAIGWIGTDDDPLFLNNGYVVTKAMTDNADIYKDPIRR